VRRTRLDRVGGTFDESFTEYGWEDIELGMRLRAIGTRAVFNRRAVAFHYKPRAAALDVERLVRQVRSQARTAVQLERKHPHWRVRLAIGDTAPQRAFGDALRRTNVARRLAGVAPRVAAQLVAADAYYDELARAKQSS
jgi:hypothetical protein